jgi:hypothetical protein
MPESPTGKNKTLNKVVTYILIGIALTILFYFSVSSRYSQVSKEEKGTRFTDFAYYMKNIEWFWFSPRPSIYRIDTQALIMSDLVDAQSNNLMLLHLTPIALITWMPLAWISRVDIAIAHAIWMGTSFTVYFASAYHAYTAMRTKGSSRRIILVSLYFLTTLSFSVLINVTTGQTGIFVTGLLMLLGLSLNKANVASQPRWSVILGLVLLANKPHHYLFGIALVSAYKGRKEMLHSIGIVLTLLFLMTFRLGLSWPLEYLGILSVHSQSIPNADIGFSVMLDRMFNFRGAFAPFLGREIASTVSILIFSMITATSLLASFALGWLDIKRMSNSVTPAFLMNLLLGTYLLFSPHIYPYEDVLILTMVIFTMLSNPRPFGYNPNLLGVLIALFLQVNPSLFVSIEGKSVIWVIKFGLWIYLLYVSRSFHDYAVRLDSERSIDLSQIEIESNDSYRTNRMVRYC